MKYKNTLQKGSVRYIVFKERGKWYAVALEFNIIEAGDDPREVLLSLFEAIHGYVKSVARIKARPHALNQKAEAEYENLWDTLQGEKRESSHKQIPFVYTFGQRPLVVA